ncbi:hypothetical protein [Ancylobacter oerskovii]|uniref:Uncharacterized protein n=2 Tax=Ancylobacter oerskovii TaxID=459519 RepID=A0ABW4Z4Y6_9HYPH
MPDIFTPEAGAPRDNPEDMYFGGQHEELIYANWTRNTKATVQRNMVTGVEDATVVGVPVYDTTFARFLRGASYLNTNRPTGGAFTVMIAARLPDAGESIASPSRVFCNYSACTSGSCRRRAC